MARTDPFHSVIRGSWLSKDPINEDGGENLYGFCFNSPTYYFDDSGFKPEVPDYVTLEDGDPRSRPGGGYVETLAGDWVAKVSKIRDDCSFDVESKSLRITYAPMHYSVMHETQHVQDAVEQFGQWITRINELGKSDCRPKVECRRKIAESIQLKFIYYYRFRIMGAELDLNLDKRPGRIPGNHAGPQAKRTASLLKTYKTIFDRSEKEVNEKLKQCDQIQCSTE